MHQIIHNPFVSRVTPRALSRAYVPMAHAKIIALLDAAIDAAQAPIIHQQSEITLNLRHDISELNKLVRKLREDVDRLLPNPHTPEMPGHRIVADDPPNGPQQGGAGHS